MQALQYERVVDSETKLLMFKKIKADVTPWARHVTQLFTNHNVEDGLYRTIII